MSKGMTRSYAYPRKPGNPGSWRLGLAWVGMATTQAPYTERLCALLSQAVAKQGRGAEAPS